MSQIIAWNLQDCVLLASDQRHTEYDSKGCATGKYKDLPGSKVKIFGKYAFVTGGLTPPCRYVENGLIKIDDKIELPELLSNITKLCKTAHESFINSEYSDFQMNGFRTVTLVLAANDRHWIFQVDNNYEPIEQSEEMYLTVISVDDNNKVIEVIKDFAKKSETYEAILVNTFKTIASETVEISPDCDIYRVAKDGVNILIPIKQNIFGRIIRTSESGARVEMGAGSIAGYNASNQRHGLYVKPGMWTDLILYRNGTEAFRIFDEITHMELICNGDSFLDIINGNYIMPLGTWDFSGASVSGLPDYTYDDRWIFLNINELSDRITALGG